MDLRRSFGRKKKMHMEFSGCGKTETEMGGQYKNDL
jgi:hypothetical protein